jgi:hypothetical protein
MVKTKEQWAAIKAKYRPLVMEICHDVATRINKDAPQIEDDGPYKCQMALELVIEELQNRV